MMEVGLEISLMQSLKIMRFVRGERRIGLPQPNPCSLSDFTHPLSSSYKASTIANL